ncbi:MAG: Dabb family protein [Bacteroidota bacterium]
MIRHIVFFRLQEEIPADQRRTLLEEVQSKLEILPALIPEIQSFEIGINFTNDPKAADLSLLSSFRDIADLNIYQEHTEHKAFIEWNRNKCPKYSVVDYTF